MKWLMVVLTRAVAVGIEKSGQIVDLEVDWVVRERNQSWFIGFWFKGLSGDDERGNTGRGELLEGS